MSQREQVRRMLEQGWTCGTVFLDERIPRYGARIFEIGQDEYVEKRRCETHRHNSVQYEWRIPNGRLW